MARLEGASRYAILASYNHLQGNLRRAPAFSWKDKEFRQPDSFLRIALARLEPSSNFLRTHKVQPDPEISQGPVLSFINTNTV